MLRKNFVRNGRTVRMALFPASVYLPSNNGFTFADAQRQLQEDGTVYILNSNYEKLIAIAGIPTRYYITIPEKSFEGGGEDATPNYGSNVLVGSDGYYGNLYIVSVLDNQSQNPLIEDRQVKGAMYYKKIGEQICEQFTGSKTVSLIGAMSDYKALVEGIISLASMKEIKSAVGAFTSTITDSKIVIERKKDGEEKATSITMTDSSITLSLTDAAGMKGEVIISSDGGVDIINKGQSLNAMLGAINIKGNPDATPPIPPAIVPIPMDGGVGLLMGLEAVIKKYLGPPVTP